MRCSSSPSSAAHCAGLSLSPGIPTRLCRQPRSPYLVSAKEQPHSPRRVSHDFAQLQEISFPYVRSRGTDNAAGFCSWSQAQAGRVVKSFDARNDSDFEGAKRWCRLLLTLVALYSIIDRARTDRQLPRVHPTGRRCSRYPCQSTPLIHRVAVSPLRVSGHKTRRCCSSVTCSPKFASCRCRLSPRSSTARTARTVCCRTCAGSGISRSMCAATTICTLSVRSTSPSGWP